ncbi:MAG: hypothetical protein P9X27_04865 [Candidatus Kaelpia aquatica]|nr:hypothetical protein [Candidatus Kaelpia aquatica]
MVKIHIFLICFGSTLLPNIVFAKIDSSKEIDILEISKAYISEIFIEQDLVEGNDSGTFGSIVNKIFSVP